VMRMTGSNKRKNIGGYGGNGGGIGMALMKWRAHLYEDGGMAKRA